MTKSRRFWRRTCLLAGGVLALLLAAGCATYHAAPLGKAVQEGLRAPDTAAVRVAASTLAHPLLEPQPFDLRDGLSPDEAAVLAVAANPDLRAVRARGGVTTAQLLAAGLLPNPQLSGSADVPLNAPPGEVTGLGLGLSFDLHALFTRGAEKKSARATLRSVDLGIAWQEWQVAQQARLQAYRAAFLRREVALAAAQEDALGANLEVLGQAAARRLVTEVDRAAAEDAFYTARTTRLDLELQRDSTRLGLYRVLGLPVDATLRVQQNIISFDGVLDTLSVLPSRLDTLAAPPPAPDTTTAPFPALPAQSTLLDSLARRRLDLAALRLGYESQQQALRAAILRQFPSITIGVNGTRDTGDFLTLGPAVSIGLPFFNRSQGQIAVARATRAQLRAEYVGRLKAARAAVVQLLAQLRDARRQLRNAEVAARAQRYLVALYGQALRLREGNVLTYYDARTTLIDKELSVLQLRQRLAELGLALEITSGQRLAPLLPNPASE